MNVPFNIPAITGYEASYINQLLKSGKKLSGDGDFSAKCKEWFEKELNFSKSLLTPSCTHSLEMAAILIDIKKDDEVIMPSFTFVSTANAFVLRGARIKFVDIRSDTMNLNENLVEAAITKKTKAIVPVHYAGVSCEMDKINEVAKNNNLFVIEDAAQGMMSKYKGYNLGGIGDLGTYSFHETKNYTSGGEGGLLIIKNKQFLERAEIIREKGTNRSLFFRGMVDKYSWVDIGSSYLPSELQAAYLYAQLENAERINESRLAIWNRYFMNLSELQNKKKLVLPYIPEDCEHNGHMFYIKVKDLNERTQLMDFLNQFNIQTAFHYVPLHSSVAGKKFGEFIGEDKYTTNESERLLRLPMWFNLPEDNIDFICERIKEFFK